MRDLQSFPYLSSIFLLSFINSAATFIAFCNSEVILHHRSGNSLMQRLCSFSNPLRKAAFALRGGMMISVCIVDGPSVGVVEVSMVICDDS